MENSAKCEQVLINLHAKIEQRDLNWTVATENASSETDKAHLKAVRNKLKSVVSKLNLQDNKGTLPDIAGASKIEEVCVPGSKEPALFQRRPNKGISVGSSNQSVSSVTETQQSKNNYTRVLHSPGVDDDRCWSISEKESNNVLFRRRSPRRDTLSYNKEERNKSIQIDKHVETKKNNITLNLSEESLSSLNTKDMRSRNNNCKYDDVDINTLWELKSQIVGELKNTDDVSDIILKSYKKKNKYNKKYEMEDGELSDSETEGIQSVNLKNTVNLENETSNDEDPRKNQICLVVDNKQIKSNISKENIDVHNPIKVDSTDFESYHNDDKHNDCIQNKNSNVINEQSISDAKTNDESVSTKLYSPGQFSVVEVSNFTDTNEIKIKTTLNTQSNEITKQEINDNNQLISDGIEDGESSYSENKVIQSVNNSLVVMDKNKNTGNLVNKTSIDEAPRKIKICLVINNTQIKSNTSEENKDVHNPIKVDITDFESYHHNNDKHNDSIENKNSNVINEQSISNAQTNDESDSTKLYSPGQSSVGEVSNSTNTNETKIRTALNMQSNGIAKQEINDNNQLISTVENGKDNVTCATKHTLNTGNYHPEWDNTMESTESHQYEWDDTRKKNHKRIPVWEDNVQNIEHYHPARNDPRRNIDKCIIPVWEDSRIMKNFGSRDMSYRSNNVDSYQQNYKDRYSESSNIPDCPQTPIHSFGRLDCPSTPKPSLRKSDLPMARVHPFNRSDFNRSISQYSINSDPRRIKDSDYNNRDDSKHRRFSNDRNFNTHSYRPIQNNRSMYKSDFSQQDRREHSLGRYDRKSQYRDSSVGKPYDEDYESDKFHYNKHSREKRESDNYHEKYLKNNSDYYHRESNYVVEKPRTRHLSLNKSASMSASDMTEKIYGKTLTFDENTKKTLENYDAEEGKKDNFDTRCLRAASVGRALVRDNITNNIESRFEFDKKIITKSNECKRDSFRRAASVGRELVNVTKNFKDIKEDLKSFKIIFDSKSCYKVSQYKENRKAAKVASSCDLLVKKHNSETKKSSSTCHSLKDNKRIPRLRGDKCRDDNTRKDARKSRWNDTKNYGIVYSSDNISKGKALPLGYGVINYKIPKKRTSTDTDVSEATETTKYSTSIDATISTKLVKDSSHDSNKNTINAEKSMHGTSKIIISCNVEEQNAKIKNIAADVKETFSNSDSSEANTKKEKSKYKLSEDSNDNIKKIDTQSAKKLLNNEDKPSKQTFIKTRKMRKRIISVSESDSDESNNVNEKGHKPEISTDNVSIQMYKEKYECNDIIKDNPVSTANSTIQPSREKSKAVVPKIGETANAVFENSVLLSTTKTENMKPKKKKNINKRRVKNKEKPAITQKKYTLKNFQSLLSNAKFTKGDDLNSPGRKKCRLLKLESKINKQNLSIRPGPKSKTKPQESDLHPYVFETDFVNEGNASESKNESDSESEREIQPKNRRKQRVSSDAHVSLNSVKIPDFKCFTDKSYCFKSKTSTYSCRLCNYTGSDIVPHYIKHHPHTEIPLSRFSPGAAKRAIKQCELVNFQAISKMPTDKYTCRFCYKNFVKKELEEFFWHVVSMHTGEYVPPTPELHQCSECLDTAKCPFIIDIPPPPAYAKGQLLGYICGKCHFTQVSRKNLKTHVIKRHNDEKTKVYIISLSRLSKKAILNYLKDLHTQNPTLQGEEPRTLGNTQSKQNVTECSNDGIKSNEKSKSSPELVRNIQSQLTFEGDNLDKISYSKLLTIDTAHETRKDPLDSDILNKDVEINNPEEMQIEGEQVKLKVQLKHSENWDEYNESQKLHENSTGMPIIESIKSLKTADQSLPSPSYPCSGTPKVTVEYKYEEAQADIMSKKHCVVLDTMMTHVNLIQIFKCAGKFCSFTTDSVEEALLHSSTHVRIGGEYALCCVYCDYDASGNAIDLVTHVFKNHGCCPYVCEACFYRAAASQLVQAHINRVHPDKSARVLRTPVVKGTIEDETCLTRKLAVPFYVCKGDHDTQNPCKFRTYTPSKFFKHMQQRHQNSKEFLCFICSEALSSPSELIRHLKMHGLKLYQCTWCEYGADSETELLKHSSAKHPSKQPKAFLRIITQKQGSNEFKTLPLVHLDKNYVTVLDIQPNVFTKNPVREAERAIELEKLIGETTSMVEATSNSTNFSAGTTESITKETNKPTVFAPHLAPSSLFQTNKKIVTQTNKIQETRPKRKRSLESKTKTIELPEKLKKCGPQDIDKQPINPNIYESMNCSLCDFSTKVKLHMVRHWQLHAPINSVPRLESNEQHFDKMLNLTSSSVVNRTLDKTNKNDPSPSDTLRVAPDDAGRYPKYVPDKQRYTCGAKGCSYISVDENLLKRHCETLHSNTNDYHCVHCPPFQHLDTFKPFNALSIIGHLKMHDVNLYACSLCPYYHYMRQILEKHLHEVHKSGQVLIVREENSSPLASTSQTVTTPTMDLKAWHCGLCQFKSLLRPEVVEHCAKLHNSKMQFKCGYCAFRTSSLENIPNHQSTSHEGKQEDIFYYYYREGSVPDDTDGTPCWVKQKQKMEASGSKIKTESNDPSYPPPPPQPVILPEPVPVGNLNLVMQEIEPEDHVDDLCQEYGEFCEPNGLKYKCPLCNNVTEDDEESMQSHLYEELKYRKWGCSVCSNKAFHCVGFREYMQTEHAQQQNREHLELPVDSRLETWVTKLLKYQKMIIEKNKENLAKQKAEIIRENQRVIAESPKIIDTRVQSSPVPKQKLGTEADSIFGTFGEPSGELYCCPICYITFNEANDMQTHLESELNKIRWFCSSCPETFQNYHEAQFHCRSVHTGYISRPIEVVRDASLLQLRSTWVESVMQSQAAKIIKVRNSVSTTLEDATSDQNENSLLVVRFEQQVITPEEEMASRSLFPKASDDEQSQDDDSIKYGSLKRCPYCSYVKTQEKILNNHILQHYNLKAYSCPYCGLDGNRKQVIKHQRICHPTMSTNIVDTMIPQETPEKYLEKKNEDTDKICLICRKTFSRREAAAHHHGNLTPDFGKNGDIVVKCCVCSMLYKELHVQVIHHNLCHPMEECNYVFCKLITDEEGNCTEIVTTIELDEHSSRSLQIVEDGPSTSRNEVAGQNSAVKRKESDDVLPLRRKVAKKSTSR